jgi:hypothetical protein
VEDEEVGMLDIEGGSKHTTPYSKLSLAESAVEIISLMM